MVDLEPIVYLRGQTSELMNKGGGGGAKPPWVDIDETGLRSKLQQQITQGVAILAGLPSEQRTIGLPLRISLIEQAYAKSNRPTAFLAAAGLAADAAEKPGQLFSRVRESELESLGNAIADGSTAGAVYAISSIEDLTIHEPVTDAFKAEDQGELAAILEAARASSRLVRLDLFPWLHAETPWALDESFGEHLDQIGLSVRGVRGSKSRESIYVLPTVSADLAAVGNLYGVRSAGAEPTYSPWREVGNQAMAIVGGMTADLEQALAASNPTAIVGVLDSGISSSVLEPWVQDRSSYDVGSDFDPEHGTFVAGLVFASRLLNPGYGCFGDDTAVLVDGQVMPSAPIGELELLERITETVNSHPDVRVWNCSFAYRQQLDPLEYTVFANEMDSLATANGILFVQAAGNYEDHPVRTWPPTGSMLDGIASPADAVNSLVVGSLSHRGGMTPIGTPASYSRRGPSFGGQTKPDVSFWSGDRGPAGEVPHSGIRSLVPGDNLAEGIGTSFATPLVSSIAANVWSELEAVPQLPDVSPALVKGLLIHSAAVASSSMVGPHKNYFGAGVPASGLGSLFEGADQFTTVHEVPLSSKVSWLRAPFPIPACLVVNGKLRAEIFMTVSYTPLIDHAFGQEAVRTCVDASFGVVDRSGTRPRISGKVPEEKTSGQHPWEAQLIAAGKWSPVRTHYARFPQGCGGDEWGLKLTLTEREDSEDGIDQIAYVAVTLRGLEPDLPVHADGLKAITALALPSAPLSTRTHITVGV